MSTNSDGFTSLVSDLAAEGYIKEAAELLDLQNGSVEKQAAMSSSAQETQIDVFERVLSSTPVSNESISLDPDSKIVTFDVTGMGALVLPSFIEKVMRRLKEYGTSKYKLDSVDRGSTVFVKIKVG